MKICALAATRGALRMAKLSGLAALAFALFSPAFASLGGDVGSVQQDQARIKGTIQLHASGPYTVHEITAPTGTTVREYVSPEGRVFGVAWQGPFVPDLKQILGTYFQQYSAAVRTRKATYVGRRPLNIQEPGLVVQSSGHMRAYFGRAYVPDMLPQGVTEEVIR